MVHKAVKIITKPGPLLYGPILCIEFNTLSTTRWINLTRILNQHPKLQGLNKNLLLKNIKIVDGDLLIGTLRITGPTLFHMGFEFEDSAKQFG